MARVLYCYIISPPSLHPQQQESPLTPTPLQKVHVPGGMRPSFSPTVLIIYYIYIYIPRWYNCDARAPLSCWAVLLYNPPSPLSPHPQPQNPPFPHAPFPKSTRPNFLRPCPLPPPPPTRRPSPQHACTPPPPPGWRHVTQFFIPTSEFICTYMNYIIPRRVQLWRACVLLSCGMYCYIIPISIWCEKQYATQFSTIAECNYCIIPSMVVTIDK